MKNSLSKKSFFILAIIWIIITFNLIKTSYAKYLTNLNTDAKISISSWDISVNNQNIVENGDISKVLDLKLLENEYADSNVIVPGSVAYFDLNIDSSNTTVDFTVTTTLTINANSSLTKDFIILGYSVNGSDTIHEISDDSHFTYIISKDVNNTSFRVFVTWKDDDTNSVNDTMIGIDSGDFITDIHLNFEQIANTIV